MTDRPWRILWVDDDPDFLHLASRLLKRSRRIRAEVDTAARADEALMILQKKPMDVIVTDSGSGPRGGLDLLKEASEAQPRLKRVMVSGYDRDFLTRHSSPGEVDLFLPKDELFTELDRKLTDFLESHPPAKDRRPD